MTMGDCLCRHMFLARLDGVSYRCSPVMDEASFDKLMDVLHWRMPYNLREFHCNYPEEITRNPVLQSFQELAVSLGQLLAAQPPQAMRLKDKRRQETLSVRCKLGSYVIADTGDGYGRFYCVNGVSSSLVTRLEATPITLREASAYIDKHHRHNTGPSFHKFSVCLRVPGESEPVGVAVASIPKARHQMDGRTLEINRCCTDPRYADVCSRLYASMIRIGREMGYRRFLTYTLQSECGSNLRAVGFQPNGMVTPSDNGWDSPGRPRKTNRYPTGENVRWIFQVQ